MLHKKWLASLFSLTLIITFMGLTFLTGCSNSSSTSSGVQTSNTAQTQTLKIGAIIPLSGPASPAGIARKNGWQVAFDKMNADGGIKIGITTYNVQLLTEDDQTTPPGATTAATKLCTQDGVKFLIGGVTNFEPPSIYKVSAQAGALFCDSYLVNGGNISSDSFDVSPDKSLLIRMAPAASEVYILNAQYLVKNYPKVKTVGLMALDFTDYNIIQQFYIKTWEPLGLKIGSDYERFAGDAVDFTPGLTRLLATNPPDAICIPAISPNGLSLLIGSARNMGFKGPIMYATPADISWIAKAGPNITDVFGTGTCLTDPNLPEAYKAVVKLGKDKLGNDFDADSVGAYDQAMMLFQLIKKAQSIDPQVVVKTLESQTNPGDLVSVFGPAHAGGLKSYGVNHVIANNISMAAMTNGKGSSLGFFPVNIP